TGVTSSTRPAHSGCAGISALSCGCCRCFSTTWWELTPRLVVTVVGAAPAASCRTTRITRLCGRCCAVGSSANSDTAPSAVESITSRWLPSALISCWSDSGYGVLRTPPRSDDNNESGWCAWTCAAGAAAPDVAPLVEVPADAPASASSSTTESVVSIYSSDPSSPPNHSNSGKGMDFERAAERNERPFDRQALLGLPGAPAPRPAVLVLALRLEVIRDDESAGLTGSGVSWLFNPVPPVATKLWTPAVACAGTASFTRARPPCGCWLGSCVWGVGVLYDPTSEEPWPSTWAWPWTWTTPGSAPPRPPPTSGPGVYRPAPSPSLELFCGAASVPMALRCC
ncbi:hypothetical protein Vafri_2177, partial [Volvox africanus]